MYHPINQTLVGIEIDIAKSGVDSKTHLEHIAGNWSQTVFDKIADFFGPEKFVIRFEQSVNCKYQITLRLDFGHHLG